MKKWVTLVFSLCLTVGQGGCSRSVEVTPKDISGNWISIIQHKNNRYENSFIFNPDHSFSHSYAQYEGEKVVRRYDLSGDFNLQHGLLTFTDLSLKQVSGTNFVMYTSYAVRAEHEVLYLTKAKQFVLDTGDPAELWGTWKQNVFAVRKDSPPEQKYTIQTFVYTFTPDSRFLSFAFQKFIGQAPPKFENYIYNPPYIRVYHSFGGQRYQVVFQHRKMFWIFDHQPIVLSRIKEITPSESETKPARRRPARE